MPTTARDIMQTPVITVSPEEPLTNVQRLFFEEEINGAPVVDDEGRVLGMITSMDLLRAVAEVHDTAPGPTSYLRDLLEFSSGDWKHATPGIQDQLGEVATSEIMTEGVISVGPDAAVPEVARTLRENNVHRVLVVEDGILRGIISTFDLVAMVEKAW